MYEAEAGSGPDSVEVGDEPEATAAPLTAVETAPPPPDVSAAASISQAVSSTPQPDDEEDEDLDDADEEDDEDLEDAEELEEDEESASAPVIRAPASISTSLLAVIDLLEEERRAFNTRIGAALDQIRADVPSAALVLDQERAAFNARIDLAVSALKGEVPGKGPRARGRRRRWDIGKRAIAMIAAEGRAMHADDIRVRLGLPPDQIDRVWSALSYASAGKKLVRVDTGTYALPDGRKQ